nr:hypothetical protein Iba_chr04aCG2800 [Ipomoea batatas]
MAQKMRDPDIEQHLTSPMENCMVAILNRMQYEFQNQNASMYKAANGLLSTNMTSTGRRRVSLHFLLPVAILGLPLTSLSCIKQHHRHYVLSCSCQDTLSLCLLSLSQKLKAPSDPEVAKVPCICNWGTSNNKENFYQQFQQPLKDASQLAHSSARKAVGRVLDSVA